MINTKTNFKLPECYKVQQKPFSALSKISRFSEEILFYMFYNMPQTYFQEAAAQELFNRKWRYHKKYSLWFSKEPGNDVVIKGDGYEKGVYIIYDPISLKQVKTECTLYYALLEDRSNSVLFNQYDISMFIIIINNIIIFIIKYLDNIYIYIYFFDKKIWINPKIEYMFIYIYVYIYLSFNYKNNIFIK